MQYFEGIGRRKTSTCRVRIFEGKAMSTVNEMPYDEYFADKDVSVNAHKPISAVGLDGKVYFTAHVSGGGTVSQLEAIQHGIGRALVKMNSELKSDLRKAGYITRDPRMVERKKYDHVKSRKKPQFSKR